MKRQTVALAIFAAALAVMVSTGIRQSFGPTDQRFIRYGRGTAVQPAGGD